VILGAATADTGPGAAPAKGIGAAPAFVDAHHHLWDLEHHRYDWLTGDGWPEETEVIGEYAAIRRTYLAGDLLRDAADCGLTKTVHVQADLSEDDPAIETRWLEQVASATGIPTAIVAYVDVADRHVDEVLARHLEHPRVRGVRSTPGDVRPWDAAFRRGVAAVGRAGLTYDLRATPDNAAECAALADALPAVTFIVGHTGEPLSRTEEHRLAWRAGMRLLAERPNVAVKISGLGMRDHAWTVDSIRPWVLDTIDIFGPQRCLFGTNWPVDALYSSYRALVEAYRTIIEPFSAQERRAMSSANAERLYRI
jgi:predicted TIM-barrel fold metal-dependent hydrolase